MKIFDITEDSTGEFQRAVHFTMLMDDVIDDRRLGKNELLVYMALCRFSDKTRTSFPGIRKLAEVSRLSVNTVRGALGTLHDLGYLQIMTRMKGETKAKTSNLYTLVEKRAYQPMTQGVSASDTPPVSATDTEVDTFLEEDTKKKREKKPASPLEQRIRAQWMQYNPSPFISKTDLEAANKAMMRYGVEVVEMCLDETWEKDPGKAPRYAISDFKGWAEIEHRKREREAYEKQKAEQAARRRYCEKHEKHYDIQEDGECSECYQERRAAELEQERREHPERFEVVPCEHCGKKQERRMFRDGKHCTKCYMTLGLHRQTAEAVA